MVTLATSKHVALMVLSTMTGVSLASLSITLALLQYANGPNIGKSTSSISAMGLNSHWYQPVGGGLVTVKVCLASPPQLSRPRSVTADTPPYSATFTIGKLLHELARVV